MGLPLSMQRDREAAQAFFTLRELWNHRTAWWRLVGVSGVAVCTAVRAEQHAHSLASKAEGAARFARHLLRRQRQRLVADKDAEKAAALAELQKQLQEAHQDELKCVRTQYEAEAAATSARHLQEVGGLENELQKLRKENLKQADKVLRLQEENGDLKKEVRCKADVISEQRANLGSLGQQLIETKEGKAKVETKLSLMIEQKAIEKGRRETLEAKVKEVGAEDPAKANTGLLASKTDLSHAGLLAVHQRQGNLVGLASKRARKLLVAGQHCSKQSRPCPLCIAVCNSNLWLN